MKLWKMATVAAGALGISATALAAVSAGLPATPVSLPSLDDPAGAACVSQYPEELGTFPLAFDGTIVEERDAGPDALPAEAEPGMTRRLVTFQVNKVFQGEPVRRVVMRTWDYDATTPNVSHLGERFLVATERDREIALCGYTRPYSEQDAAYWTQTFE